MAFSSWTDFVSMGGHGVYVWSAYGVTFLLLLACVWVGQRRAKKLIQRIKKIAERKTYASRS